MSERELLREFILGGLPTAEAEALEERLFHDGDLYEACEEERLDLIESFVAGELYGDEAIRFNQQCERSPELLQKVEHLRLLRIVLRQKSEMRKAAPLFYRTGWNLNWLLPTFALVAAFLIAILAVHYHRDESVASQLAAKSQQPQPGTSGTQSGTAPSQSEAVAFLSADVVRGLESIPHIRVSPEATMLQLQIEVPQSALSERFWEVQISHKAQKIFDGSEVLPKHAGATTYLSVSIPIESFKDDIYTVQLKPSHLRQPHETRIFSLTRDPGKH